MPIRVALLVSILALVAQGQEGAPADTTSPPPQTSAAAETPAANEAPAEAPAPTGSPASVAAIVAFVVLLVGGLCYLLYAMEQAWFLAGRAAAVGLGCGQPSYKTKTLTEDFETHQWLYEDVPMLLQTGSRIVAAPGSPAGAIPITAATVTAELPKKLPFQLTIAKPNTVEGARSSTGDATFDEELWVVTSLEEAASRLLEDATLRDAIRELLQSSASLPTVQGTVREGEVELRVFDRKRIREHCLKAASLARALSRRAEKLGLLEGRPAKAAPAALALPEADPAKPALALDGLTTLFPGWRVEGPVVFREEAVYVFLGTLARENPEPGQGQVLGAAGGLLGAMVGAAIDKGLENARGKPDGLYFGHARDVSERLGGALSEAPGIVRCQEYFVVPRADVQRVELDSAGALTLMTSSRTFRFSGEGLERAKCFLAFRGYTGRRPGGTKPLDTPSVSSSPPASSPRAASPQPGLPPVPKPAGAVQTAAEWLEQARAHAQRGETAQARRCFAQATERDPGIVEAWVGLGRCLAGARQFEDAVRAFDRALKVNPGDAEALREKGRALLAGGLLGSALAALQDAASRDATDAEAAKLLRQCRERMGKL